MSSSTEATFEVRKPFDLHRLEEGPSTTVTATKEELMHYLREMLTIRRMEVSCDQEYKMRNIRGFCHLYDGQEAVAVGGVAALDEKDDWITSYRCHAIAYVHGVPVRDVLAELFGFKEGNAKGKGGSMHMYNKSRNFWGGAGIVGGQVPVGTGIAFANKYNTPAGEPMPVCITAFGDGAANQGQVWESANMAKLWGLPVLYMIENNRYGMGTSTKRSSCNPDYFTQGNIIPGIRVDGMDVLAVREGLRFAKQHASTGNGPMFVEMVTYRYHGHSMSDPGISYRDRSEVKDMREHNDCIELLKSNILKAGFATEDELKSVEKEVRKQVQEELQAAKSGSPPPEHELAEDIELGGPAFVRGVELSHSY